MTPETRKAERNLMARLVGSLLLIVVGLVQTTPASAVERRFVWERQDQFVAVEKQDGTGAVPARPNDHPAQLTAETLRATLGVLRVKLKAGSEPETLFTEGELETLGEALRKGLSLAGPDEDVTFALIGFHHALFGVLKQPMVTTGRVFFSQGTLNLILGMVHNPVGDREDRRLKPFIPGSRSLATSPTWSLTSTTGETVQTVPGRPDWLALTPVTSVPTVRPVDERVSPPVKAPGPAPVSPPAATGVEDRLQLLKRLHEKGLVSDEEYRAKRLEILKDL